MPKRAFDAWWMVMHLWAFHWLARWLGMPDWLINFEVELTRNLDLFDREHYLSQINLATLGEMSAIRHYVLYGDALGLSPCPMFDIRHYDAHCGARRGLNRLLHYGLVTRFKGLSPTPWFDVEYYRRSNPDVVQAGMDPLVHFQRYGWRDGRNPLPGLDMRRLMSLRPELRVVQGNALSLLASGGVKALLIDSANVQLTDAVNQSAPVKQAFDDSIPDVLNPASWAQLQPKQGSQPPQVTVVIPVYGGQLETLRCLWTVLTAPVSTPHRVLVINDAGPVPELNAMIRSLAARELFTLEQHRSNLGFVKTINHGLRLTHGHDVVILNSDTEVYGNWLDRLLEHAKQHPRLGTITPLSNNATICSYPQTLADNKSPLELSHAQIDQLAAQVNAKTHVLAPTGVGFCMYIRYEAVREVGMLDERRFGRGYGEENDLCQRMLSRGWSNAIACDVYVKHLGSVSFMGEAALRTQQAGKTLAKLYPRYATDVARFIADDSLWIHRARLDLARLAQLSAKRNVLLISHSRGGGTERHLLEQTRELLRQGVGVFEMRPALQPGRVSLSHVHLFGLHNLSNLPFGTSGLFDEALTTLRITELHIHHLIDFSTDVTARLIDVARRRGIAFRLAVHDYYMVCPRVNMVDATGRYCGEPRADDCNRCLRQDHLIDRTGSIETWRQTSAQLLAAAQQVVVPSNDVARRLAALVPGVRVDIEPHEKIDATHLVTHQPGVAGSVVRVLVIGAINHIKGFDVMLTLARSVQVQQALCEVMLLGYSSDDSALAAAGVRLLGRYFDDELLDRIAAVAPHLIFVPSVWPETYCYVLSGALNSGCKVAVFDLGAQAERAREHGNRHLVLPLSLIDNPNGLLEVLLAAACTN